jgi:hypothetical protein
MIEDAVFFKNFPKLLERDKREPGFARALDAMGKSLGLDPNGIAAVMSLESGFDPQAVNKNTGATGLVQFMPNTAIAFGTTVNALRRMSAIEQLPFVRKLFTSKKIRPNVMGDYYMSVFMPAFVGSPADTVLGTRGQAVYDKNAGLDVDKDGTLTVGDVTRKIDDAVEAAKGTMFTDSRQGSSGPLVALASVGVAGFLFFRTLRLKGKA